MDNILVKLAFGVLSLTIPVCCTGCLVSNHMFIPQNAKKQTDFLVEGEGYAFECYAPNYSNDLLEITFHSKDDSTSQTSIKHVKSFIIEGKDTIPLSLDKYKNTYRFRHAGIKNAKKAFVLVEYGYKPVDSLTMKQIHSLRKVRDYFFTIH
ncbi:hypothetical protein [Sabulibacter ruber]|uniref:hypothetical protein n=1 Tax=Sabulibacter ruber TaxID=2811901 RepID=UPI001A96C1FF|nr:hypothetical protein [Sabulibacter ruber]